MPDFPPVRPFGADFPPINPTGSDPRVATFIPENSVGNAQLQSGLSPLKFTGIGAKVYRSTNQSIPDATETLLSFDTEVFDQGNFWAAGSPTIFTVPDTGVYLAVATVQFDNASGNVRRMKWSLNGSTVEGANTPGASSGTTRLLVPMVRKLTKGDTLGISAYQNSGGALNVDSGEDSCAMTIVFLFGI